MGYCVTMDVIVQLKNDNDISKEDVQRVLDTLPASFTPQKLNEVTGGQFDSIENKVLEVFNEQLSHGFSWVNKGPWKDLKAAFDEWRYTYDPRTRTVVEFDGEKLGDDMEMWTLLAPFIKEGSYIQIVGEDGDTWRWVFDGQTMSDQNPQW